MEGSLQEKYADLGKEAVEQRDTLKAARDNALANIAEIRTSRDFKKAEIDHAAGQQIATNNKELVGIRADLETAEGLVRLHTGRKSPTPKATKEKGGDEEN